MNEKLPVALEALRVMAAEKKLQLKIQGDCMAPLLLSGVMVLVKSARFYWPGDCLVFIDVDGRLVAHRLTGYYCKRRQIRYLTQGDRLSSPDASIMHKHIIGKVCGGECDERLVNVPFLHRLWAFGRFCRFIFARLFAKGRK